MVSVLPNQRTPFDILGPQIGQALQQVLPGAVQQGYQRQMGLSALDEAQKAIETSGGDPYKIALAFARAGVQNPSLERALGPLTQTAMQMGRAQNIYGGGAGGQPNQPVQGQPNQASAGQPSQAPQGHPNPSDLITPSKQPISRAAYANTLPPDQQIQEAQRRSLASGDSNTYPSHLSAVEQENNLKLRERENLGNLALSTKEVTPDELSEFLDIGSTEDTRNPDQWLINTGKNGENIKIIGINFSI